MSKVPKQTRERKLEGGREGVGGREREGETDFKYNFIYFIKQSVLYNHSFSFIVAFLL